MVSKFLPFYLHGIFFGITTDTTRGWTTAVRQKVPKTLSRCDTLDQPVKSLRVVPLQRYTSRIRFCQKATFEALYCPGKGNAGGDGIQAEGVTKLIAGGYGCDIIH